MTDRRVLRLRDLGPLARLGVAMMVLVMVGGTAAAGAYLYMHHDSRDERPEFTIDDVKAHYHGISSPSPLLAAIESGHPAELPGAAPLGDEDRAALVSWLRGDPATLDRAYDNFDLGDLAPAAIMDTSCLSCHARSSAGEHAAPGVPLEYWDDIRPIAFSRDVQPVSVEILAASTHTHALGMASSGLVMAILTLMTSWPRRLAGLVVGVSGVGLALDIGSWWLTREFVDFAYVIAGAGAAFNGGMCVMALLVWADLLMPAGRAAETTA